MYAVIYVVIELLGTNRFSKIPKYVLERTVHMFTP